MSDAGLQQIICAALVDNQVVKTLIQDPLALADRFGLTLAERRFVVRSRPRDLEHFASLVEGWVGGLQLPRLVEETSFARVQRVG